MRQCSRNRCAVTRALLSRKTTVSIFNARSDSATSLVLDLSQSRSDGSVKISYRSFVTVDCFFLSGTGGEFSVSEDGAVRPTNAGCGDRGGRVSALARLLAPVCGLHVDVGETIGSPGRHNNGVYTVMGRRCASVAKSAVLPAPIGRFAHETNLILPLLRRGGAACAVGSI